MTPQPPSPSPSSSAASSSAEPPSTTGALARLGFTRTDRVQRFLAEPALAGLGPRAAEAIGRVPDPDEAVLGLLRFAEASLEAGRERELGELLGSVGEPGGPGERLIRVLGTSVALGDFLTRHPDRAVALHSDEDTLTLDAADVRARMLGAVGAVAGAEIPLASLSGREGRDALRIAYHERLLQIAAADVTAPDPVAIQPFVSASLADLAGASLEAALAIARTAVDDQETVRLAVLAMGKTGARELNFISDVDVVYVAAPAAEDVDEQTMTAVGSALCRELARVCADRTGEGSLWQVDANLRPEGKDGELVRSLDSYRRYYQRWAESWEFQALLKARFVAGDAELGHAFEEMVEPWIWQASTRDGFVEDTRAMRRRVIAHIPHAEADRNIKLGPGGLRDVEFTVQLLQMVHGRTDESLHVRGTLPALERLGTGGYISRRHVVELDGAYRFLRTVEHRLQLHRMRRTQVLPTAEADLRRLARSVRVAPQDFRGVYERTRRRVRQLHEEIFYRPLLLTSSQLSDDEVRLSAVSARARLAAIGYRDPRRAVDHIRALTEGISRRAAIQRQLLPALLEWFADGIDPDLGLLAFRRLSDTIGSAHWYLALLRDSGVAARRLTRVLSSSRFVGEQLEKVPEAVRWLGRDDTLRPLSREKLHEEFLAVIRRVDSIESAQDLLRRARLRELLRISMAHLLGLLDARAAARGLTDLAEAVLEAGLLVAYHAVARERGAIGEDVAPVRDDLELSARDLRERRSDPSRALGVEMALVAMGSFGAREMGYASDADVQFVFADRGAGEQAGTIAVAIATQVQRILNAPSAGADMKVNADLRPEGRNGLLARSLDAWRDYYRRDALTWEKQALVRARVVVASRDLQEQIEAAMDLHRYPRGGLGASARREIATMKARVESERLPRGTDPARHLKLGRGSMTDVEWVAQLLVLEHGHEVPELRSPTTLRILEEARRAELLTPRQQEDLTGAWTLAWQMRRAIFLWRGREGDVLPADRIDLYAVAVLVDGDEGSASELEENYLRATRHARTVAEEIIFGDGD
ncbi:bifunctional [glutamine synthetase] adenylyltransferase/[glutamine synthetase]-adenylyl-L-tyrosine phosphorylase [Brachybacterium halotolerans subsp. kimchii]|uniref:bifunctional [glutamine synthetase] adenylyltransferase/[glutamine synthetase]-adenylyl-L-tyrosine phosphorylase n=1 Tax=Brachybacterium halotolerans TaxID=2795215 RepID=UPI001E4DB90A|nr:bifunctional [glutamine synthetase] adenylyltransferase/[glutamine synthetase]-adenylyl-L-tyrosine phosphorylase [Brachybacterium halotolerans]UEJ83124.1 bifunctional [glutamine synthetase] adenylyltransferase/[glutamine synthetase]-adenylyl-L-tyrosine phosphorylase [Brachybacterium halotolerans subsp. kimchii]